MKTDTHTYKHMNHHRDGDYSSVSQMCDVLYEDGGKQKHMDPL